MGPGVFSLKTELQRGAGPIEHRVIRALLIDPAQGMDMGIVPGYQHSILQHLFCRRMVRVACREQENRYPDKNDQESFPHYFRNKYRTNLHLFYGTYA
jgi:hypothetical protein